MVRGPAFRQQVAHGPEVSALLLAAQAWSATPDWERSAWVLSTRSNVTHSDLPSLLEEARTLAADAESWSLVYSDAALSRDVVRATSGDSLVADLDGLLGFFGRQAFSIAPTEQPWWGAVWPIRQTAEDAVYQQTGMVRHHRGVDVEALSVAVRDWQVLRTPMGAVAAYEAEHCLAHHLLLYQQNMLVGTFKQASCLSTQPTYTDEQWSRRAEVRAPDWLILLDNPSTHSRETLHMFQYGQDGGLLSIHVYRWLTLTNPEHLVYVPASAGAGG